MRIHVDDGARGVSAAIAGGNIVIIVDVLRFSSTVATAIANGFTIIPCGTKAEAEEISKHTGAPVSGKTGVAAYSLSPLDYLNPKNPEEVILVSPNGAACAQAAVGEAPCFIGCFLNARTLARVTSGLARDLARDVTLIAAGEVKEDQEEDLQARRFAIEDYLGCGFILTEFRMELTAEAELCRRSYEASKMDYAALIKASLSGQYLVQRGHEYDISHVVERSIYEVIPVIRQGRITAYSSP